ncbi:MAG: HEPN domain-containing protein [Deltaproteobacteria bacterium]|nr:HEPN domain-containing protein [Deltaproteobacteria bacterium]
MLLSLSRGARQLHEQRQYNEAASKAYYAVFHSLQAILLTVK